MIKVPRFKANFHVQILPPDRLFLLSEGGYYTMSAHSCVAVAELIDGQRSIDEITEALAGKISLTQVYYVLSHLEKKQYIEEAVNGVPVSTLAFWNGMGSASETAVKNLASQRVSIHTFGDTPVEQFTHSLQELGINIVEQEEADFWVVLTDDYEQVGLEHFNHKALESNKPWLLAKPNGSFIWIGPIFHPGQTGCWECLRQRLKANRDIDSFLRDVTDQEGPYISKPFLPSSINAAINLTATEIAKWVITGKNETLNGKVITVNMMNLSIEEHTLVHRPQCPACGDPGIQSSSFGPIKLQDSHKKYVEDGGHRSVTPEVALQKFEHHVSPITGVVNKLVRITDKEDTVQHVYVSGANMAVRHMNYDLLRSTLRSRTAGKGKTDIQAKVSAIGEAIERYSGTYRGDEARITATFKELNGKGIDPRKCMLFSDTQYSERDKWLSYDNPFMRVPFQLNETASIEWAPIWSLTHQEIRYLPMEYCYYSYPVTDFAKHFCLPDSNGCAAGTSMEEAILQGFLELIERDGVALWWYNMVQRPGVDLDSFNEPYIKELQALHKTKNRDIWALDLTSDFGIPVFLAISRRNDKEMEDIVFAPASHLDPRIGLLRALTELNQLVTAVIDVDEEGYTFDDESSVKWWQTATLENQPYLMPSEHLPASRLEDFKHTWSSNLKDDILMCRTLVEDQGHEFLVLDQTRPDIEMKVAKVVVPGLRHFWARFGEGRLFDVPVKLGWLEHPRTEDELNPIPIFI